LALCAILYQANAIRLFDEDIEFGTDGQELIVDHQENGFITLAQQANTTHGCTYVMD
jgi:hypothetical protein